MSADYTDDQDLMDLLTWKSEEIGEKNIVDEWEKNPKKTRDKCSPPLETLSECPLFSPSSSEEGVSRMVRKAADSTADEYSDFSNGEVDLSPFSGVHKSRNAATNAAKQTSSGCSLLTLDLPEEIFSALYPHQKEGVQWLFQRHCHARGALLADEMGLGKTVQVCAFLGQMYRDLRIQSTILVVPVTLISFWLEMLSRWGGLGIAAATSFSAARSNSVPNRDKKSNATVDQKGKKMVIGSGTTTPSLSPSPTTSFHRGIEEKEVVVVIQGETKLKREAKWRRLALCAHKASSGHGGGSSSCLVLTSYHVIRQDVPTTLSVRHAIVDYLILDESHQIKDSHSSVCQSVLDVSARHRLALSGTPVMNSFEDLWSLFRFLDGCRGSAVTAAPAAAATVAVDGAAAGAASSSPKANNPLDTDSPDISTGASSCVEQNSVMNSTEEKKRGPSVSSSSSSRAAFRAISRSILRGNERDATRMERHTADKELAQLQAVMDRFSLRREKCKVWSANPSLSMAPDGTVSHTNAPPLGYVGSSSSEVALTTSTSPFTFITPGHQEETVPKRTRETPSPSLSSSFSGTSVIRTPQNLFSCQKHDVVVWISLTDLQRQEYDTVLNMKAEGTLKGMKNKRHIKDEPSRGMNTSPALPPHFCFPEDLKDDENREQTRMENMEDPCRTDAPSTLSTEKMLDLTETSERVVRIHSPSMDTSGSTTGSSRGFSPSTPSPPPQKSESGALGLLSLLRDVCQHPWLHLREDSFSAALGQLHSPPCEELGPIESGSKLLVALTLIQQHLRGRHAEEKEVVHPPKEACESENGMDQESPHRHDGSRRVGKVLVFSQSKRMLRLLGALLEEAKIPFLRLDGEVKADQRATLVHRFNSDNEDDREEVEEERRKKKMKPESFHEGRGGVEHAPVHESGSWMDSMKKRLGRSQGSLSPSEPSPLVALLSTQVGGTGLTFHTASGVILLDPSWNPAVDNQCVDRVHRIGQKFKEVFIYRLVTCGTVEEKMYRNQIFKMTAAMQSVRRVPRSLSSTSDGAGPPTTTATVHTTRSRDKKEKVEENTMEKENTHTSFEAKSEVESQKLDSRPLNGNGTVPLPHLSSVKMQEEDELLLSDVTTSLPSASDRSCGASHSSEGGEKRSRSCRETSCLLSAVKPEQHPRREKQEKFYRYFTRIQLRNMFDRGEYDSSETAVHIENLWTSRDMPYALPSCTTDPPSCATVEGSTELEKKENMHHFMDNGGKKTPSRRGVPHSILLSLLKIPYVVDVNSNDPAILFGEDEERENV